MTQDCRNKRVRLLVHKLNKARKQQAKQIDILCHDFIGAQRDFIQHLGMIRFAGSFYKSLIGIYEQKILLDTVGRFVHEVVNDASIVIFVRQSSTYKSHTVHHLHDTLLASDPLEHCFNDALIDNLCLVQKPYGFEDMQNVGLQVNPILVDQLAALAIPVVEGGHSLGLILLYRSINKPFSELDIEHIRIVAGGMARVLKAGQMVLFDRHD